MHKYLALLLLLLFTMSCTDSNQFGFSGENDFVIHRDYQVVVGFDLRNDSKPRGVLRIGHHGQPTGSLGRIVLPFESKDALAGRGMTTWSSFGGLSHFGYIVPQSGEIPVIQFQPLFASSPSDGRNIGDTKGSIFLLKNGQRRTFILRGFESDRTPPFPEDLRADDRRRVDAVAVLRPEGAEGVEVRDGQTELPKATDVAGDARYYVASNASTIVPSVELSYLIPLSKNETLFSEIILWLMGAIAPALAGLAAIKRKDIKRKGVRNVGIALLLLAELGMLLWLANEAISNHTYNGARALAQAVVVIVGIIVSSIPIYVQWKNVPDPLGSHDAA